MGEAVAMVSVALDVDVGIGVADVGVGLAAEGDVVDFGDVGGTGKVNVSFGAPVESVGIGLRTWVVTFAGGFGTNTIFSSLSC